MPRPLKPKPPITAHPICVSDQNCFPITGLTGDQFRAFLKRRAIPHTIEGRRIIVRVDVLLDALAKLEAGPSNVVALPEGQDDGEPSTAADVLAALGRRAS